MLAMSRLSWLLSTIIGELDSRLICRRLTDGVGAVCVQDRWLRPSTSKRRRNSSTSVTDCSAASRTAPSAPSRSSVRAIRPAGWLRLRVESAFCTPVSAACRSSAVSATPACARTSDTRRASTVLVRRTSSYTAAARAVRWPRKRARLERLGLRTWLEATPRLQNPAPWSCSATETILTRSVLAYTSFTRSSKHRALTS